MIALDVFLKRAEELGDPYCPLVFYKEAVPLPIQCVINNFIHVLQLGGKIPIPVIAIDLSDQTAISAYTYRVKRYDVTSPRVLSLIINIKRLLQGLSAVSDLFHLTSTEAAILVATHEARHCLQLHRAIDNYRGIQWLDRWLHERNLDLDRVPYKRHQYTNGDFSIHRLEGKLRQPSRHLIHQLLRTETDASAVSCAATLQWRLTSNLLDVARVLHC